MKNKYRFVMNIIILMTYLITSAIVLVIFTKKGISSDVYLVLSPMAISAIVCIILNMIGKNKK